MSVYVAIFEPREPGYYVSVPDVPGCVTSGDTFEDAIASAKDALCGCLCVYEDEGTDLPAPHMPKEIDVQEGAFALALDVDLNAYRRETDNRAVRKNVSLPAWMANMADKRGINCSQVLQEALAKKRGVAVYR